MRMKHSRALGYMVGTVVVVVLGISIASVVAMNTLKQAQQGGELVRQQKVGNQMKVAATILMDIAREGDENIDLPPSFAVWCPGTLDKRDTCADYLDTVPLHGGKIPANYGGPEIDAYGKKFGYCAWNWNEAYTEGSDPYSGGGTISGSLQTTPLLAIVSAGPDGVFSTDCQVDAVNGIGKNDDEVFLVTVAERGSFDLLGMEGYPDCEAGLPAWTGTEWECREVNIDVDGDGSSSSAEQQIVDRMIACAKCGKLTCGVNETTSQPLLYDHAEQACTDEEGDLY